MNKSSLKNLVVSQTDAVLYRQRFCIASDIVKATKDASAPCSVFEIVDATNDEQYYTVGIWLTLEAALAAIEKCGDNPPGENLDDEKITMEIRERKIGVLDWSECGSAVAEVFWIKTHRESDDSYEWRREQTPNDGTQRREKNI